MASPEALDLLERRVEGKNTVLVPVPVLVKGKLFFPSLPDVDALIPAVMDERIGTGRTFVTDRTYLLRQPGSSEAGAEGDECRLLVFPKVDPHRLLETDPSGLVNDLVNLPFQEVLRYVGSLGEALLDLSASRGIGSYLRAVSLSSTYGGNDEVAVALAVMPLLMDPESLHRVVDKELGDGVAAGSEYLDRWVHAEAEIHQGFASRAAEQLLRLPPDSGRANRLPKIRAMPTRQLHITPGNSPLAPCVSILRAFATKGAAAIKMAAGGVAGATLLTLAMEECGLDHPLTRHSSIVYWPGGDRTVEDVLLAEGSFDRIVVWGSGQTVSSVAARASMTKLVLFKPRIGLSFIGRDAFEGALANVAIRAVTDVMIDNQQACTSSLVHYVEASEDQTLEYCRVLQSVLARWGDAAPSVLGAAELGRLRMLRRGHLVRGRWFENVRHGRFNSAVVYAPSEFDLSLHPMCRLVVVRRVDNLHEALPYVNDAVAAVGVYPERIRLELRDDLAARGVTNVCPLGECGSTFASMPHDGMRVLSELVNWTCA
jgi:Acyl-CoA reductase (LuxC)